MIAFLQSGGDLSGIAQQGGFALLAAVCVWAIVAVAKIGVVQMEKSHMREIESMKLSTEVLKMLAADRADLLRQVMDTMLEVRTAMVGLQDEVAGLHPDRRRPAQ
jgi:hypothetical protein